MQTGTHIYTNALEDKIEPISWKVNPKAKRKIDVRKEGGREGEGRGEEGREGKGRKGKKEGHMGISPGGSASRSY